MRPAVEGDLPELIRMAHAFHSASGVPVEFDEETFADLCLRLMADENSLLLVADGGMLAALCFPIYFNANALVAQELFWWVDEGMRGKGIARELLTAAERWAKARGARMLQMIALDALDGDALGQMYQRRGYVPLERSYARSL